MKTLFNMGHGFVLGALLVWVLLGQEKTACQAELVQAQEGHQIVVASLTEQLVDAKRQVADIDMKWVAKVAHVEQKYKAANEELGRVLGARVVIPEPEPMKNWEVALAPVSALLGRWSPLVRGIR